MIWTLNYLKIVKCQKMCRKLKIPINSLAFTESSVSASFTFKLLDNDSVDVDDGNVDDDDEGSVDDTSGDEDIGVDENGGDNDDGSVDDDDGIVEGGGVKNWFPYTNGGGKVDSDTEEEVHCEVCSTERHAKEDDWDDDIEFWSWTIDEEE